MKKKLWPGFLQDLVEEAQTKVQYCDAKKIEMLQKAEIDKRLV